MLVKRLRLTLTGTTPFLSDSITLDIPDDILQSLLRSYNAQNLAECVIYSYNVLNHPQGTIPTISYSVEPGSNPKTLNYTVVASGLGSTDQATVDFIIIIPHSIIR